MIAWMCWCGSGTVVVSCGEWIFYSWWRRHFPVVAFPSLKKERSHSAVQGVRYKEQENKKDIAARSQ
jgi:hypothetical protein